ncbi:MAG: hypothetical protein ACYTEZ_00235 [Planctomycetota bacterium]|jgi:hypothetical protein
MPTVVKFWTELGGDQEDRFDTLEEGVQFRHFLEVVSLGWLGEGEVRVLEVVETE